MTGDATNGFTVTNAQASSTTASVSKFETGTTTFVPKAELCIIDKDSNEVVTSWTTDEAAHKVTDMLESGKTYILRETKAPDGYDKALDVEFKMTDGETPAIEIGSGATP